MTCPRPDPLPQAPRRRHPLALAATWLGGLLILGGCASTAPGPVGADATSGDRTTPGSAGVAAAAPAAPVPQAAVDAGSTAAGADPASTRSATAEAGVLTLDPMDPTTRIDFDRPSAQTDLWTRVRGNFAMQDLDDDFVRKWEQFYANKPDYMHRMMDRGGRYLFHIVEELDRRKMPAELALLPFIESAFNPQAKSVAKASGMWQFIPGTGRDFDLKQNLFRDDRRSVLASTQAALDYLQQLHGMFGDWHLALAAYNWGQGNVRRAIDRNLAAGLPTRYENLRMPDETRNYVPKLQAMKNIVANPERFSLQLLPLKNHPYFISVAIDRDIDVERAARMAQLPMDEFRLLNPQMNKPVILASGTPQVLLPYDNANHFVRALMASKGQQLASWTAWVAPRTMKVAQAAQSVGMTESELRAANNIPPRMLVKAGSTLLITRSTHHTDVASEVADHATLALAPDVPPLRTISFRTGRQGESVAAVARRYRLSATQVAAWNKVSPGGRFAPRQVVVVKVPQGSAALASASRAAPSRDDEARGPRQSVARADDSPRAGQRATARSEPVRVAKGKARSERTRVAAATSRKASGATKVAAGGSVPRQKLVKPSATARSKR